MPTTSTRGEWTAWPWTPWRASTRPGCTTRCSQSHHHVRVLPAVLVMETLRRLDSLSKCESVGYATSAEASGDRSHVVGYAAALFR